MSLETGEVLPPPPALNTNSLSQTDLTCFKLQSLEKELNLKNRALETLNLKFKEMFDLRHTETEKIYEDYKLIAEERYKFSERVRLELQKENEELKEKLSQHMDLDRADELSYLNHFYATFTGLSLKITDGGRIHCGYPVELDDTYEDLEFTLTPCQVVNQNRRESTSRRETLSMSTPFFDYQPIRVPASMKERMGSEMQFEQSEARWFFKRLVERQDHI
ncbi:hypothetical protein HMI56_000968 [Coelomomyces lativittatus]|nr:hypothetical protein HMI56_000968 [Coelomomyces lativittatus]